MKRCFQYALVLALAASMAASSQAEICPMKLQGQHAEPCGMSMPGMKTAHHHGIQTASGHDCCPKRTTHNHAAQPQCPTIEISACMSAMTCCSLDPQPQLLSQSVTIQQPVTVGIVNSALLPRSRASLLDAGPLSTPENPVFRLKEDLRI